MSDTAEMESSVKFCETCQEILIVDSSLSNHQGHEISTVEKFAGGVKRKLHELHNEIDFDEKNLIKAAKIVSKCSNHTRVITKSYIMKKVESSIEFALEKCERCSKCRNQLFR